MLKISIITVCFNSEKYIESAIRSVIDQTYLNIEYIIIDGGSKDSTISVIEKYKSNISVWISEPDTGIYDAMNKGITIATGDIIGILNSDDFLSNRTVIEKIANEFNNNNLDSVYGDVKYVNPENLHKSIRYYSSRLFKPWFFRFGMMPPHASFYARKRCFDSYGLYKTNYRIVGDLDLLIRFLYKNKITSKYLDFEVVTMRTGGLSTNSLKNKILLNNESFKACRDNGIYTNYFFLFLKYIIKSIEIIFYKRKRQRLK